MGDVVMKKSISLILSVVLLSGVLSSAFSVPISAYSEEKADIPSENISQERATDSSVSVDIEQSAGESVTLQVMIEKRGNYKIGIEYYSAVSTMNDLKLEIMIDGEYPFEQAHELTFPRMWRDSGTGRVDSNGNEYAAEQVSYENPFLNYAKSDAVNSADSYTVYLSAGIHTVRLIPKNSEFVLTRLVFGATAQPADCEKPKSANYYTGEPIVIEGESAKIKSTRFLVGKTDSASVNVTPHSYSHNVVNYIGGGNWKNVGDSIVWQTPEVTAGWYQLGFSFRQNTVIGGKTYRMLEIDGKVPFKEAQAIGFTYGDNWQRFFFSDSNGEPYLIYLSEGVHEIALEVTAGEIAPVQEKLTEAVNLMSRLYVDITMITGENVDIYRDYNLFLQISDMEERLNKIREILGDAAETLAKITGQKSGSNYSVIQNMIEVIDQMLNHRYEAHRYKSYYYSNYCSVSSVLKDLCSMPLDIDKMELCAPGTDQPFETADIIERINFSVMRFLTSFVRNYSSVSTSDSDDGITIWVNWGRDQAQVLSSLVDRSFTSETGIPVSVKLVNANIIQATLSGNGPDCILQHSRSEPVNLAMRGVLYDLTVFSDLGEVLKRFQSGAEIPYRYKEGLYALPDTQTFYMMFYRTDVLNELNVKVPKTWDEFKETSKILMRNNMSVWLPNNPATDNSQVNSGVGSNNIFPSMLLQKGLSLYTEDGKKTALLSADVMTVFEEWTNYYTKLKFPVTLSFYTRFRTGTTPIGIAPYNFYTTIKVAAPEIDGLWSMAAIPGTVQYDGTVNHASSGGGTGCAILKNTKHPKQAWEFLKWWTDTETQLTYSNDVESVLGPSGRVALSNVEAIKGLSWDYSMLDSILEAWNEVQEIPEYPGSYYVSRSIYQSFWNVVNDNQNTKDMLMEYGTEADEEIARKWQQYSNKN